MHKTHKCGKCGKERPRSQFPTFALTGKIPTDRPITCGTCQDEWKRKVRSQLVYDKM